MGLDEKFGRRHFLATTAAAAAFTIVPRHVLGGPGQTPPSQKLNIAGIGIGGQGAVNLKNMDKENIVALCDVDPNYADKVVKRYPQAKFYIDYREMLEAQKDIDAVMIATPDHTHAVITMAALKAGKHVYCQKPLTHNVWEARMIAQAAKEAGVVTQMGIQGHSGEGARLLCEWIGAGLIGEVTEVDAYSSVTYYPWGHAYWSPKEGGSRPKGTPEIPKGMNWDLWLGPAPYRPYHPAYHPLVWRAWRDFGNGWMGDRGVHTLDPVVTALKLGAPTSVDATVCGPSEECHPVASIVTFLFPARHGMAPVKLNWYEGTYPPRPEELEDGRSLPKDGGSIFKGTKGTIVAGMYGESPRIIPESKMQATKRPPKTLPRIEGGMNGGHELDFLQAIKMGKKAGADFAYSGPLTETCLLGLVAKWVGTRLEWDARNMKVTNVAEANRHLKPEYRGGWTL